MHSFQQAGHGPKPYLRHPKAGTSALQQAANKSAHAEAGQTLQTMADHSSTVQRLQHLRPPVTQRMDDEELMQGKAIQRMEEDELQMMPIQRMEDDELQGKFIQRAEAPKANNTGLPDNLKAGIENLSGMSMDHVKVHRNSNKPAAVQAHAYAQGSNIHLGPGQEKHLPHEAWHVVQQAQGRVKPTRQLKGIAINDDSGLEKEADVMGAKALALPKQSQVGLQTHKGTRQLQPLQPRTGGGTMQRQDIRPTLIYALAATAGLSVALVAGLIYTHGATGAWIWVNARVRGATLITPIADLLPIWTAHPELSVAEIVTLGTVDTTRLGGFEARGEGLMTVMGLIMADHVVDAAVPNAGDLNANIERWRTADEGSDQEFGSAANEAEDMAALNAIFGIGGEADARAYRDDLLHAYVKLSTSNADVGRELGALLAHSGTYAITLRAADDSLHQKQVTLKLIVRPGIPGQFLSPFEQGMTLAAAIAADAPLTAVIMWDPTLHFAYFKPRAGSEGMAEDNPARRGDVEDMEPWVVLAHELGHFTDFLNRPNDFLDQLTDAASGGIGVIEEWNLPREQAIVAADLGKTPRDYYQDFPGGENAAMLGLQ